MIEETTLEDNESTHPTLVLRPAYIRVPRNATQTHHVVSEYKKCLNDKEHQVIKQRLNLSSKEFDILVKYYIRDNGVQPAAAFFAYCFSTGGAKLTDQARQSVANQKIAKKNKHKQIDPLNGTSIVKEVLNKPSRRHWSKSGARYVYDQRPLSLKNNVSGKGKIRQRRQDIVAWLLGDTADGLFFDWFQQEEQKAARAKKQKKLQRQQELRSYCNYYAQFYKSKQMEDIVNREVVVQDTNHLPDWIVMYQTRGTSLENKSKSWPEILRLNEILRSSLSQKIEPNHDKVLRKMESILQVREDSSNKSRAHRFRRDSCEPIPAVVAFSVEYDAALWSNFVVPKGVIIGKGVDGRLVMTFLLPEESIEQVWSKVGQQDLPDEGSNVVHLQNTASLT